VERGLNLVGGSAFLVDCENPLLEIHTGLDGPKHLVGSPKDTAEKAELFAEEFE
jgi:hypothetical protein